LFTHILLQSLPALIMKIMRGTFAPPAEHYTQELKDLVLNLLQLDPDMRPNANQIMAKPIVINTTLMLLDIGSIQCKTRYWRLPFLLLLCSYQLFPVHSIPGCSCVI